MKYEASYIPVVVIHGDPSGSLSDPGGSLRDPLGSPRRDPYHVTLVGPAYCAYRVWPVSTPYQVCTLGWVVTRCLPFLANVLVD